LNAEIRSMARDRIDFFPKSKKMENLQNNQFGKFEKNQIDALSSIKGGTVAGDTSTTLCKTTESTFDTDSTSNGESVADRRCSGNFVEDLS
jgi:hypothetical protein